MANVRIYINEQLLELRENTVVPITLQVFDLAELETHQVNYTRRIRVPKTNANKAALGYADQITSDARNPYKVHDARVISGGIEIIPSGTAIISETNNDYVLVIYSGIFDLFETLNGLTLHDLPLLPDLDHDNTVANAAAAIYSTTTNSLTMKGLRDDVTYEVQVQTICSSSESSFTSSETFTTGSAASPIPSALKATEIDSATARLSWGAITGASDYEYRYKEDGGSYGAATSTSGNEYANISGLTASTLHYFQARSIVSGVTSDWSSERSFDTTAGTFAFTVADIGTVGDAGYGNEYSGNNKLVGSGSNIGGTSDGGFAMAYQTITGDGEIVVRLHDFNGYNSSAIGGIMVRDSLNANSKHASMVINNAGTVTFKRRSSTGGSTANTTYAGSTPIYLKLVVASNKVTGFYSSNGTSWTQLGPAPTITSGTSYIGFCVCNYDNSPGTSSSVQMDTVALDGASGGATCGIPSNVGISSITGSSALVSWTAGAGAVGYNVQFRQSGQSDWILYTNPYIYPAIQYGTVVDTDDIIDIRYSYPAIYTSHLVADAITAQGYKLKGSFFNDPFYYKLALPFSKRKWEHSDRYVNERSYEGQLGQVYSLFKFATATTSNQLGALIPLEPVQAFTAPGATTIDITVKATISDLSINKGASDTLTPKLCIYKNSGGTPSILNSTNITIDGNYTVSQASISLVAGDTIEAAILADYTIPGTNTISYGLKIQSCQMYSDPTDRTITTGDEITAEAIIPDMNQKAFVKAIGQKFGCIFVVDTIAKTVEFKQIKDIKKNIYKAKDWSNKLAKPQTYDPDQWYLNKKTVLSSKYGQKSFLRYLDDDTVPSELGDSYLTVNNEVIEEKKTLVSLPWAASNSQILLTHSKYLPVVPYWESDGAGGWQEVKDKAKQRFVYIDRADADIDYYDGTTTSTVSIDSPFAKFKDPTSNSNLDFVSLKNKSYGEFQDVLTDAVLLEVKLYLTPSDIVGLDHFIPVYFDRFDSYFYVNKIKDFVEGELTTVELVKIG